MCGCLQSNISHGLYLTSNFCSHLLKKTQSSYSHTIRQTTTEAGKCQKTAVKNVTNAFGEGIIFLFFKYRHMPACLQRDTHINILTWYNLINILNKCSCEQMSFKSRLPTSIPCNFLISHSLSKNSICTQKATVLCKYIL